MTRKQIKQFKAMSKEMKSDVISYLKEDAARATKVCLSEKKGHMDLPIFRGPEEEKQKKLF